MSSISARRCNNAASFFLDRHIACGKGDRTALIGDFGSVSYAALAVFANRIGNLLLGLGVQPENRVALMLADSPLLMASFYGVLKIGAVAVPLNTYANADLLAFYLNDSRAGLLIVDRSYAHLIESLPRSKLLYLLQVVYSDELHDADRPDTLRAYPVAGDDAAFWLYTSGSQGPQKAVVHRHSAMRHCAHHYGREILDITADDRVLSTSKMFFAYGLGNSAIFPLSVGATTVLCPERPDADLIYDTMTAYRPTLFFGVPRIYKMLLESRPDWRKAFANVRMCLSAGEYLPTSILDEWMAQTGKLIYDGIGSTEAMHIFCSNTRAAWRAGTTGRPVPGYQLKLVDAEGNRVAEGSVGRLLVRGETLAKGYWNRHELNQKAFHGEWLNTGDLFAEEDGFFRFAGRQGDVFKCSGLWVSPVEVEQAILTHEHISSAAVVPAQNEAGLTVPKAYVVLRRELSLTQVDHLEQDVQQHLSNLLARFKIPKQIEIVSDLPTTATGKLARHDLRTNS